MFEPEVIAAHYGYPCRYAPTIMSGPVVRWGPDRFEVSASRDGVMVQGYSPTLCPPDVFNLKALLDLADATHQRLARLRSVEPMDAILAWLRDQAATALPAF